jgi:serine-type D-Ala-D-Ala carboxypeptidase
MYDIASVTKQIVATGVLKLIELKKIGLNEPIRKYLPIPDVSLIGDRTIWHLLTHTSNIQLETSKLSKKEFTDVLYGNLPDSVLVQEPGTKVHYGNINTYLLGEIISKVSGKSLAVFLQEEIFDPLGMEHTMYCPPAKFQSQIPPTEILSDGAIIKGIVHDEGARMLGGEVGQAGLFSSVSDLTKFIMFWTSSIFDSHVLKQETIEFAVKNHTPDMNLAAGLGWHLDDKVYLGNSFKPGTFFHPGFTGTIIGGNRKTNIGFVFLSNCTYPHREGNKLKNEIFQSLLTETFPALST